MQYRRGLARYVPIERIAVGGMGEVWRGHACFPDGYVEEVALKRILPWLSDTPLYRLMLEDEARLGLMLKHDNIVRVYDARMQGSFLLVMEYVHGRSLSQLMASIASRGAHLPIPATLHVMRELARALEYTNGAIDEWGRDLAVVHGDVSPHNVLLSARGDIKLMDFGLARATANLAERDPQRVSGKPGYVAPEVLALEAPSQQSDLFGLGVVAWECLAGRRLFKGKTPLDAIRLVKRCEVPLASSVNPAVPAALDHVLARMLAKDPAERYHDASAFGEALDPIIGKLPPDLGRSQCLNIVRKLMRDVMRKPDQVFVAPPPRSPLVSEPAPPMDDVITSVYQRPADTGTYPTLS